VPHDPQSRAAPLFDRNTKDRSFVPTDFRAVAARGGGQGRPSGRRGSALPWTAASPAARLWRVGAMALALGLAIGPGVSRAQGDRRATSSDLDRMIAEAAMRFAIPERWIRDVMHAESGFDARALSRAGAIGLMQLMPQTYAELRARYGLGADPYQPRDNILAGAAYLREMYDRYGAPGFLAAYNAGPSRYEQHLAVGRALPGETRAYVASLSGEITGPGEMPASAHPIAVARRSMFVPVGRSASAAQARGSLFAALTPRSEGR